MRKVTSLQAVGPRSESRQSGLDPTLLIPTTQPLRQIKGLSDTPKASPLVQLFCII